MGGRKRTASSSVFQEATEEQLQGGSLEKPTAKAWYENKNSERIVDAAASASLIDIKNLKAKAEKQYSAECRLHRESLGMSKSDIEWFNEVTTRGTTKDKIAAYAMAVQDGIFFSLPHLEALLALAKSANKHEVFPAVEGLKDAIIGNVIVPKHRKLFYLHQRPLDKLEGSSLILWHFEDKLKGLLFELLKCIEKLLQENVEYVRERSCRWLFELAMAGPHEQTQNTLALLANKLGDPDKKLSSRIIYYLEELIKAHPSLTEPIIEAVQTVMTRTGVPERALYYGLTFLSQLKLSRKHPKISIKLLGIYNIFFKSSVIPVIQEINRKSKQRKQQKGKDAQIQEPPRVSKAVLTGIHRALPFVEGLDAEEVAGAAILKSYYEPLMKMAKMSNAGISLLSLSLIYQLLQVCDDNFQRTLFFQSITTFVGEWSRLARFSQCYSQLFTLLDKIFSTELKLDKLEKLLKRLLNSAAFMETAFAIRTVQFLEHALQEKPSLKALLTIPPENVLEARDCGIYEIRALYRHFDPTVAAMTKGLLEDGAIPSTLKSMDPWEASCPKAFLHSIISLQPGKSASMEPLISALKQVSKKRDASEKKEKQPKAKKSRTESEDDENEDFEDDVDFDDDEDISEPDFDDGSDLGEEEGEAEDDDNEEPSDFDDIDEDLVFESAGEESEEEPEFEMD